MFFNAYIICISVYYIDMQFEYVTIITVNYNDTVTNTYFNNDYQLSYYSLGIHQAIQFILIIVSLNHFVCLHKNSINLESNKLTIYFCFAFPCVFFEIG